MNNACLLLIQRAVFKLMKQPAAPLMGFGMSLFFLLVYNAGIGGIGSMEAFGSGGVFVVCVSDCDGLSCDGFFGGGGADAECGYAVRLFPSFVPESSAALGFGGGSHACGYAFVSAFYGNFARHWCFVRCDFSVWRVVVFGDSSSVLSVVDYFVRIFCRGDASHGTISEYIDCDECGVSAFVSKYDVSSAGDDYCPVAFECVVGKSRDLSSGSLAVSSGGDFFGAVLLYCARAVRCECRSIHCFCPGEFPKNEDVILPFTERLG